VTIALGNESEGYLANDRLCFWSVAFREDGVFAAAANSYNWIMKVSRTNFSIASIQLHAHVEGL
jgi:hypothetical protein